MPTEFKNKTILVSAGTMIGAIISIIIFSFKGGVTVTTAENELKTGILENRGSISQNKGEIDAINKRFATQQNYLYTIKSDLKKDIDELKKEMKEDNKNTENKVDKIYDFLIK